MLRDGLMERISTVHMLEGAPAHVGELRAAGEVHDAVELLEECRVLESDLSKVATDNPGSRRLQQLALRGQAEVRALAQEIEQYDAAWATEQELMHGIDASSSSQIVQQRARQTTATVQLIYQEIFQKVKSLAEPGNEEGQPREQARKESFDQSTNAALSNNVVEQAGNPSLTPDPSNLSIIEQLELTTSLCAQFCPAQQDGPSTESQPLLEKLLSLTSKLMTFQDFAPERPLQQADTQQLDLARRLLSKLHSLLTFIIQSQCAYLASLCKFSYVSQRVFVYLIYQGFCGHDEQDQDEGEDQAADDRYLDGCGMGDGQGDNNVSNEIEHEEQLEGLKQYESEEEQQEQQEQGQQNEEEEGDNDFEMQEDFDGKLEDEQQQDEDKDDKDDGSDADDALDHVSDMLDNELWDKNMEDMEQQEEENGENEDQQQPEEVDLGDRELDEQNQLEQKDKEMAAGDHDK